MLSFKTVRLEKQAKAFLANLTVPPWECDGESFHHHMYASLFILRPKKNPSSKHTIQKQCSAATCTPSWENTSTRKLQANNLRKRRDDVALPSPTQTILTSTIVCIPISILFFVSMLPNLHPNVCMHPNLHPKFFILVSQIASQFYHPRIPNYIPISSYAYPNLHPKIPNANPNCQSKPSEKKPAWNRLNLDFTDRYRRFAPLMQIGQTGTGINWDYGLVRPGSLRSGDAIRQYRRKQRILSRGVGRYTDNWGA